VAALLSALQQRDESLLADADKRIEVLELAARLCAKHDFEAPWLLTALLALPGMGKTAERLPPPNGDNWMAQVSRFFAAYRGLTRSERVEHLQQLLTSPLPPDVHQVVRSFLAYTHRSRSNPGIALLILEELLAEQPDSEVYRYQVARTLSQLGHHAELQRHLREYPLTGSFENRLKSDLAFERGELAEALTGPVERAAHLRSEGKHRIALENESAALWRATLAGVSTADGCEVVISEADRYGMDLLLQTGLAAKAIHHAGDETVVAEVLRESRAIIRARSGVPGYREWTAELIHALRVGDRSRIHTVRQQWDTARSRNTPNYRVVDQLFRYAGYSPTYPTPNLGDGHQAAEVDRRWHGILDKLVRAI
jgi:hypothetical protein